MTSDGTEVSVRATVANTAAPGEGVWNQTPVAHRSSNFPLVGGRVGFRTVYGIAKVHQFTLETDPDDNGTWTTEYAGTFDHPSGHATVFCDHDDAGNLTFDGVYRYGYDAWNRLVEVRNAYREGGGSQNVQEGSVVTAMAYDGLGRRIVKTVSNSGELNATLHSLYDAQSEIEERDGEDRVLRQQVWGLDYIDELVVVSTNLNPQSGSSSQDPDPQQCDVDHYAVLDAQFNVLGLIGVELEQAVALVNGGSFSGSPYQTVRQTTAQNPQGSWPIVVVERYEYTPYGQRQVYRGSKNDRKAYTPYLASARLGPSGHSLNPFGHQGLKHDEGIGLVYNRARMLHPGLGRFVQRDPLGYVDGANTYGYVDSQPTKHLDPSGESLRSSILGLVSVAGRPGTFEIAVPFPGPAKPFCDVFGTVTIHDQDQDCCVPFDISIGVSCRAKSVIDRINRSLPRSIRRRVRPYIRKIPNLASIQGGGIASSRYCDGIDWSGLQIGILAAGTFGNGRRGGGTAGSRLGIGGSVEFTGGYDFGLDQWYGDFTAVAGVSLNAYFDTAKRYGLSFNRDFEMTCDLTGGGCSVSW